MRPPSPWHAKSDAVDGDHPCHFGALLKSGTGFVAALQRTVQPLVYAWVYGEEIRRLDAVILGLPLVLALPRIKRCL